MPYQQIPIETHSLDELRLDLDNYRIPLRSDSEGAALRFLFASEDVMGAAKSILRDGYFDNEVPIATRETAPDSIDETDSVIYVIREGNRRVAALKCLQDPSRVPSHEKELRALLKRYAIEAENLPSRIRIMVPPTLELAEPHIARVHTGLSKRAWSLDQQATFYYSLIEPGVTVADIKAKYPDVNVKRFVRMASVRRFLSGAKLSTSALRDFVSSKDLAMSSFEYAYKISEIAVAIGLEFSSEGFIEPTTKSANSIGAALPSAKLHALEVLVKKFMAGELNTRSIEFKQKDALAATARASLLAEMGQRTEAKTVTNVPNNNPTSKDASNASARAREGSHSNGDTAARPGGMGPDAPAAEFARRGPNSPNAQVKLSVAGLDYEKHLPAAMQKKFMELRQLNLNDTPIATAMMLRSILETCIKFHFEGSATPAVGELSTVFKLVESTYGSDRTLRNSISKIRSGQANQPGSIAWMNLISHGVDIDPTRDDLHAAWNLMNPIIRRLVRPK